MTPAQLADAVLAAAGVALADRGLDVSVLPATTNVVRPRSPDRGDYASTLALQLAGRAGVDPRELAGAISVGLTSVSGIRSIEVAGPGFLNIRLDPAAGGALAGTIVAEGECYGRSVILAGQRIRLGFTSADGTDPGSLGHARRAAVGESLARILAAAGAEAIHVHYASDIDGARGCSGESSYAVSAPVSAPVGAGAAVLREDGHRLLTRADGERTCVVADAAYFVNQRERGFDRCIYLPGAGRHGYVDRHRAVVGFGAVAAGPGDDPGQTVEVLACQSVSLLRGAPVRRGGQDCPTATPADLASADLALDELVDAVGADVARYSLVRSPPVSPLTLDPEAITRQSPGNPVFTVRYAAARAASVSRNAEDLGVWLGGGYDPALLDHGRETELLRALGAFPDVVSTAAELREPHRIARYLEGLAGSYHGFVDECRIIPRGDEPVSEVMRSRLWLSVATRVVLVNGLGLLGVTAPERI